MQDVQTLTRFVVPFTMARTRWMLGFQRRFERTWEWLIVTPNDGFLPHTSHTAAMTRYLDRVLRGQVTLAGGAPIGARLGMAATRQTGTVDHDGESIYYERIGSGNGDLVVLGHGLGGNHASFYQQVGPLTAAGYDVLTWDQRGFGASSRRTGAAGPVVAVDDLAALLDHVGVDRAHVVGQSMGGWTAMGFAVAHPQRLLSLTLTDTLAGVMTDAVGAALRADDKPQRAPIEDGALAAHPALGERFCRDHPDGALLYQQLAGFGDKPDDGTILELLATTWYDLDTVAAISVPVLAIVGSEDQLCPRAAMAAVVSAIPGARLEVVDGAGHSPYFEVPDEWNRALLDFLGTVPTRQ